MTQFMDPGYFYCPYVPITRTPAVSEAMFWMKPFSETSIFEIALLSAIRQRMGKFYTDIRSTEIIKDPKVSGNAYEFALYHSTYIMITEFIVNDAKLRVRISTHDNEQRAIRDRDLTAIPSVKLCGGASTVAEIFNLSDPEITVDKIMSDFEKNVVDFKMRADKHPYWQHDYDTDKMITAWAANPKSDNSLADQSSQAKIQWWN